MPIVDVDLTRGDQHGEVRTVDHVQYQDQDEDREKRTVDHIQDQNQDQDTEVRTVQDAPDQAQRSRGQSHFLQICDAMKASI